MDQATIYRHLSAGGPLRKKGFVSSEGGKGARFELSIRMPLLLGIDIGARHWRIAAARDDPNTPPLEGAARADEDPSSAFDDIAKRIKEEFPSETIQGILVGTPYPLRDDKTVRGTGNWSNIQLRAQFRKRLPAPFLFDTDSDVNLGALAELDALRGDNPRPLSLLYVKWSSNVRAASVVDGLLHNANGLADAYLHEALPEDVSHRSCSICRRPCVASYASLTAVFDDLGGVEGADTEERTTNLLTQIAESPDSPAAQRLEDAAVLVGRALGRAANTVVPDSIVLGGAFKRESPWGVIDAVSKGFDEVVAPHLISDMNPSPIGYGTHTGQAAIIGAKLKAAQLFAENVSWGEGLRPGGKDAKARD